METDPGIATTIVANIKDVLRHEINLFNKLPAVHSPRRERMILPNSIPAGARIVVRTDDGIDPGTGRQAFRDFVGHVISWDAQAGILELNRDASANGQRPAEHVTITAQQIVRLKPVPERPRTQHTVSHSPEA